MQYLFSQCLFFMRKQIRKKVEQAFEGLQGSRRKKRRESVNDTDEETDPQPSTTGNQCKVKTNCVCFFRVSNSLDPNQA